MTVDVGQLRISVIPARNVKAGAYHQVVHTVLKEIQHLIPELFQSMTMTSLFLFLLALSSPFDVPFFLGRGGGGIVLGTGIGSTPAAIAFSSGIALMGNLVLSIHQLHHTAGEKRKILGARYVLAHHTCWSRLTEY